MEVTAVEPRRKGMSALFIDGEFAMNLDTQTLIENRISPGRVLDDEFLHKIIQLSNERRAKEKALWLISSRDHSKKELTEKIRRTCDEAATEKAVERLEELGLVNDENFAKRYAEQLLFTKHMSKRGAKYELARKGIERNLIEDILDEIEIEPREQIRAVLEKKYRLISDEKTKRRAVAALQRLGFGWEDIKCVIEEFTENTEDDFL